MNVTLLWWVYYTTNFSFFSWWRPRPLLSGLAICGAGFNGPYVLVPLVLVIPNIIHSSKVCENWKTMREVFGIRILTRQLQLRQVTWLEQNWNSIYHMKVQPCRWFVVRIQNSFNPSGICACIEAKFTWIVSVGKKAKSSHFTLLYIYLLTYLHFSWLLLAYSLAWFSDVRGQSRPLRFPSRPRSTSDVWESGYV